MYCCDVRLLSPPVLFLWPFHSAKVLKDRKDPDGTIDQENEIREVIQAEELKVPTRNSIRIAIDHGPNMYRRIVTDMVAGEGETNAGGLG